jgi:nitroreductase
MVSLEGDDLLRNDMLDLLRTRRSVAPLAMSGPGPSGSELELLLTIAARVPDHGKLVPWRFIVFEGEGRAAAGHLIARAFVEDNPDANEERVELERQRLSHAPLVIGVVSRAAPHVKIPEWEQVLSAGAVCMNLVVAANAMGYAASWLTQWYSYDRRVLHGLGLAPHEKIAGFVHVGSSASAPQDRVRPVLSSITSHFQG